MVKEVASKTSDVAGDGTTTATILAESIFDEGLKNITAGANAMQVKRGIEKAVEKIVDELQEMSMPATSTKQIEQVATCSANQDVEIGQKLAEAMAPGGGFIFCTAHNIQADTPIENILEMLRAYKEYGAYR